MNSGSSPSAELKHNQSLGFIYECSEYMSGSFVVKDKKRVFA